MEGNWSVYFENKVVGTCRIWKEGLYYRFHCRCDKVTETVVRLLLQCGDTTVDLGILIPVDSQFGLEKKLAVRNVPAGEPRFSIKVLSEQSNERFIPVREDGKFDALSNLENGRFGKQAGIVGVFLS